MRRSAAIFLLSSALVGGICVGSASALPLGQITEFSAGLHAGSIRSGKGSIPGAIAVGPDGNLWFTDDGRRPAIGRITPSGAIAEFSAGLSPGSFPDGIAAGPDGNLWFTDSGSLSSGISSGTPAIGRITTSGAITEFSDGLSTGTLHRSAPKGIAAGPDGNLWFTDLGVPVAIGRITTSGATTEFSTGLNDASHPVEIAAGPDGNLWFTDDGNIRAIGRITTSGAITEFSSGLHVGSSPSGIVAGPDGNLWFADERHAIGRITTSGAITEFSVCLNAGSRPSGIAAGPDGNLWFTDSGRKPAIGRIGTGNSAPQSPSNAFCFRKLKQNKRKGTAILVVHVPGPGTLTVTGSGVIKQRQSSARKAVPARAVSTAGNVKFLVKARGEAKKKLSKTGRVNVKLRITFTPTGGDPRTQTKRVKLIKK